MEENPVTSTKRSSDYIKNLLAFVRKFSRTVSGFAEAIYYLNIAILHRLENSTHGRSPNRNAI